MNSPTLNHYAIALQLAALRAELAGFSHLALVFRALLEKEVRG